MIDDNFDIRSDSQGGDPDKHSNTLHGYHLLLWSKPLPDGQVLQLEDARPDDYLRHNSDLGEFFLSSDQIIHTFDYYESMRHLVTQIPQAERDHFAYRGSTVGGTILFPSRQVAGKYTINQARGTHPRLRDRFDLTLECIRRHYEGGESPLSEVLERYATFFALFDDFRGYVEFWLLQDLVDRDLAEVRFFTDWKDFSDPPVPRTLEEYLAYREQVLSFVDARNARIASYARDNDI